MITTKYPVTIRPLTENEGGGFLVEYPDLPGCMADGASIEEALKEGEDAIAAWIATAREEGVEIPEPGYKNKYSGQFRARLPKSLHAELAKQASIEGVSLNTLTIALLAEGLMKHKLLPDKK